MRSIRERSLSDFWLSPAALVLATIAIFLISGITIYRAGPGTIVMLIAGLLLGVFLVVCIATSQQEWIAGLVIIVGIIIDWYQLIFVRFPIYATSIALVPIGAAALTGLQRRSWVVTPRWWLVLLLLVIAAPPIIWAVIVPEALIYYITNFFTPMLLYMLGILIAQDQKRAQRMLSIVAGIGTLLALHTIIIGLTGVFLLQTSNVSNYLASVNDFTIGSSTHRAGSFLLNPDWTGAFFAMLAFLPIGLLTATSSPLAKLAYLVECVLMLLALLFTYTASSWLAIGAGLLPLILVIGRGSQRFVLPALICAAVGFIYILFPQQSNVFIQHLTDPNARLLRLGAWQTAIRVILAHPLTGIGLGLTSYLVRADPYRVPMQYRALSHPHDTYLEIAAMAGIPTLLAFLLLLGITLWLAYRNWLQVDSQYRSLWGTGILLILIFCANCLTINGWTLAPLANIAWLILGVISAPVTIASTATIKLDDSESGAA